MAIGFSLQNHIKSNIFYFFFDCNKIAFNIVFDIWYDQGVSGFILCEDPQKSIFYHLVWGYQPPEIPTWTPQKPTFLNGLI